MRKSLTLFVVLGTLLHATHHTLTLDALIKRALEHSPDVKMSKLDFSAAKARTKAAYSLYMPQLDLHADAGKQWSKLKSQPVGEADLLIGTLSASQLLYDFGKTSGAVNAQEEEALAYEAQMYQSIADKIFAVKQAYYEILKAKGIVNVQRKNVALQKQQLERAQKYLKAGIKTIIDLSDAKVRLEQARRDLNNAKYQVEYRRAQLEQIIGTTPYNGDYNIYMPNIGLSNLSKKLPQFKSSVHRLEQFAYTHRAIVESSKHFMQGARSTLKSIEGDYYPTVGLRGEYSAQKVDQSVVGMAPQRQGHLSLSLDWNLFSGYRTDAQVQEAKVGVLKAASQAQSIKLAVKQQVLEAHIRLRQSRDNVKLNERITDAARKKLQQAQKRYENDLGDFIELQNAQQDYINALSNLVNSYYDYFIALAQLDHAIGK